MTDGSDRFEGIVVRAMPGQLDLRSVQKIGELRALGVHVGVVGIVSEELVDQLAADERSSAVVVFSDEEGVEIVVVDESGSVERTGLSLDGHHRLRLAVDDREHATQAILDAFWQRGIAADATLVASRAALLDAVDQQIRRRLDGAVPRSAYAACWGLTREGFHAEHDGSAQAVFALSDAVIGSSGAPLGALPGANRRVLASGVYTGEGSETHLLGGPIAWHLPSTLLEDSALRRAVDFRTGVVHEELSSAGWSYRSVRFSSLARPGTAVLRAQVSETPIDTPLLLPPAEGAAVDRGEVDETTWVRTAGDPGGIVAAGVQQQPPPELDGSRRFDRIVAYHADAYDLPEPTTAIDRVRAAARIGFDGLLNEHRRAWSRRWEDADVVIDGDDELQTATRFALFHLMGSAGDRGETAVGARGLSGPGYRGHVFWDADTFVLPFLAATHPPAARSMLEYRIRRLPAAIEAARRAGRDGARFPWESAHSGEDVTPLSARDRTGRVVPIRTGQLEEHIVAQVAWASCCYADWTGDEGFARGAGLRLLIETARYWASRVRSEPDGSVHIYGVIGPDEYHEPVDDNAFTNVMARWNLRRALAALQLPSLRHGVSAAEQRHWSDLVDGLVDGFDANTGIYEQFAGFHRLEPLLIADVAPRRPIAADLLLGAERVRGAQVVKQADVLMLHHLVPEETAPESLEPNLRFYEPRTAHGSSLSPAIHAAAFARARDFDRALDALRIAGAIDLEDLTGTTAGGLHLATMGGFWQAFAFGFAGLRAREGLLHIDPRLPPAWRALEFRVRFRDSRVRIRIEASGFEVEADEPIGVEVGGAPATVGPGRRAFRRKRTSWEVEQ